MIPDLQMLDLAQAAYVGKPTILAAADCYPYLTVVDNTAVWAFRGTNPRDIRDVLTDCDAVPVEHPQLGTCHPGFQRDVSAVIEEILRLAGDRPLAFCGHSKGAAEAADAAALCEARGRPVCQLTTFGMPRPGALNGWLTSVPGSDFWNGDDPVPDLPTWLPHPRSMVRIGRPAWKLDVIDDHILTAYRVSLLAEGATIAA
jgi:hypothetical protein